MTELKLYKFLNENGIEHHWFDKEFIVFIPFHLIREFTELVGENYLSDDGGQDVKLQSDCICLDITEIAEFHEINLEDILEK